MRDLSVGKMRHQGRQGKGHPVIIVSRCVPVWSEMWYLSTGYSFHNSRLVNMYCKGTCAVVAEAEDACTVK
jgi:hypothetical protein